MLDPLSCLFQVGQGVEQERRGLPADVGPAQHLIQRDSFQVRQLIDAAVPQHLPYQRLQLAKQRKGLDARRIVPQHFRTAIVVFDAPADDPHVVGRDAEFPPDALQCRSLGTSSGDDAFKVRRRSPHIRLRVRCGGGRPCGTGSLGQFSPMELPEQLA
jgi:hypothetical protein